MNVMNLKESLASNRVDFDCLGCLRDFAQSNEGLQAINLELEKHYLTKVSFQGKIWSRQMSHINKLNKTTMRLTEVMILYELDQPVAWVMLLIP